MTKNIDRGPADDEDPVSVSQGLGGATGAAAGAGLGAVLGPAGIIVGGLAGAVGGWWAGREVGEATDDFNDETDAHYRRLHTKRHADVCEYDEARSFYQLGSIARRNPDYSGQGFDEVEQDLKRGWRDDVTDRFTSWDDVREFVRAGYESDPRGA
jgi:uncharacterized protein YcfJ